MSIFFSESGMIKHLLPPANKVCEGNVFTGVCLPTRGGMRGLGACVASGGMRGRARASGAGGGGVVRGRRDGHCSGHSCS